MSRPVLRAGGLTRQRLSLLWCKESLCFAFHKGSIPAERFPYAAKFLFTTKSPLLQNSLCYKIPFAANSPLLQNPLCYKILFAAKSLFTAKFLFATKSSLLQIPFCCKGPEGFQRATGKPFGRLRRGEILRKTGKYKEGLSLAIHKKSVTCERFRPPAGGRGTFPHGKVPKGCRGRPKGACLMAAPGPPVAKQQCTASLAGARPAGFTSVPGRATVAFGAADPSPGVWAPVYPWCVSKGPLRQEHLAAVRAPAPGPCTVRAHPGTRLVAGPWPNQMACPMRTLSVKQQGEAPQRRKNLPAGFPTCGLTFIPRIAISPHEMPRG